MKKRTVVVFALIGIFTISLISAIAYNVIFQLSAAPATSARVMPININSASFKVYDKVTGEYKGMATNDLTTNTGTWRGGDQYPDIECFTSDPFFVTSTGATTSQPVLEAEYAVVGGMEYIATGTYYGIDVGARTHVNLASLSHPTRYEADVSPFDKTGWYQNVFGGVTYTDDYALSDFLDSSTTDHAAIRGSTAYSCNTYPNFHYDYGSNILGYDRLARITQSLAPFYHEWARPGTVAISGADGLGGRYDNLDHDFFTGASWTAYKGLQLDYIRNFYKIKAVNVVPELVLETSVTPIWAPYTKEVTFLNGTTATLTTRNTRAYSGFRSTYICQIPQYEQKGQITSNTYSSLTGKASMPNNPATSVIDYTSLLNGDSNSQSFAGVSIPSAIEGKLWYMGPAQDALGNDYQPSLTGMADSAENIQGLPQGNYHFSITEKGTVSNFETTARISESYTLQPASSLGWARMQLTAKKYIYQEGVFDFVQDPPATVIDFYYPYALWTNNMYFIQRWIVEVWTLSTYKVNLVANGKPVTVLPSDREMTDLVNDPNMDNNLQYIPIPKITDWAFVAEVVGIVIVALIVLGIIGSAMLQKKTINIRVPMQQQQSWFDQEIGAPRPQQQKPMMIPQRQATPPKKQQPERINKPPPAKKGKGIGDWFKEKLNPKPPPRYRFRGRKNKT